MLYVLSQDRGNERITVFNEINIIMALIKCKECGHEVSDKASACPNCGCPIDSVETYQEQIDEEPRRKNKTLILALVVALLCLVGGGGYFAYYKLIKGESDKDVLVELTPEFIKAIEKYDQLGIFSEGYAAVRKGNKWGYINTKGEEVIPVNIEAYCVGRFSEGKAFVATMGKHFYVIDKKGNTLFQGEVSHEWESEFPESSEMPYFLNGKMYVHTGLDNEIYELNGKKGGSVTQEERDSIEEIHIDRRYFAFDEETQSVGEAEVQRISRLKWGIKDSIGTVLIAAKYDEIIGCNGRDKAMNISNGVVLVVLEEPEEDHYTSENKYDPSIRHYGYVDLKGNDTFSEALKEQCRKAEHTALDNYKIYLNKLGNDFGGDEISLDEQDSMFQTDESSSYKSERIVTVYMRGSFDNDGNWSVTGNYGAKDVYNGAKRTGKIQVPYGKVWALKDYRCQMEPFSDIVKYHAEFCDDSSLETMTNLLRKGWWKPICNMNGERLVGGKTFYIWWGAERNFSSFYFEANFIERDE